MLADAHISSLGYLWLNPESVTAPPKVTANSKLATLRRNLPSIYVKSDFNECLA